MSDDAQEIVDEIVTKIGRERAERQAMQEAAKNGDYIDSDGARVTPKFLQFMRLAQEGKLPDPGDVPEVDPEVRRLIEELTVVHLPEWRTPSGRKIAEPAVARIPQAARLAQYLVDRGWAQQPERERIRWAPTPGGLTDPFDTGLHYERDENGEWPVIDPEAFWDIEHIETKQQQDGTWVAAHHRGIAFTGATKSEAYAGLVDRIRNKIEEAKQHG
ncbi:hypothetical protein A5780_19155 [Nocardia sp. 852002-20019_SCH5090214]|uniref:hypothetical protein n=1 Tax=Nocardia sp. 852002-20019_SCH5090214 TaxID=1834087 RepID=UPI0007EA711E|nr:hypothetical protein [Nocardia sp. 852002-20019_SCH5090214]OBA62179.1 hypothetical protein A5780_19155 [Nocardia sp. 852002-20019_SCH5090214]